MTSSDKTLTVAEAAARLDVHEETVRRHIRSGRLPATQDGFGPKAPFQIAEKVFLEWADQPGNKHSLDLDRKGVVTGFGDFAEKMGERYGAEVRSRVADFLAGRAEREHLSELVDQVGADLEAEFEQADEDAAIERAAHDLAARIRRAERIRERAEQILDDDNDG